MSRPAALRLDRLLANLGYGTRSQVQQMLRARRVVLDGSALDDPGLRIPLAPVYPSACASTASRWIRRRDLC